LIGDADADMPFSTSTHKKGGESLGKIMEMMRKKPIIWFFILTYALSWGAFGAGFVIVGEVSTFSELIDIQSRVTIAELMPFIIAASFGPFAAALFMMAIGPKPKETLLLWLKGFIRLKVHPFVYVLTFFVLPFSYFLILTVLGVAPLPEHPASLVYLTLLVMPVVNGLATALLGAGPIGGEPGWRGYALPRLLKRSGDLHASLVLGVFWALWHLPLMVAVPEWRGGLDIAIFLPSYVIGVLSLAYVLTKIWRWSHGSIILAIWFHGLVNFTVNYPVDEGIWNLEGFTDVQLNLITIGGMVLTALIFALVSLTPFARKRANFQMDVS
jgi:membrane protease YdiL (CAAX protease family)